MTTKKLDLLTHENQVLVQTLQVMGIRLDSSLKLLAVIANLTTIPVRITGLGDVAAEILRILVQGLDNIDGCSILLYDPITNLLKLVAARGEADIFEERQRGFNRELSFQPGEGIAGKVFTEGQPCFWDKGSSPPNLLKISDELATPESLACLPLSLPDRHIGVLNISFITPKPFDPARQRDLNLLSGVVANIIQTFVLKGELEQKALKLQATVIECQREIQERIHAQNELKKMQEQLAHAQKMEAIGTLASGIAHDFNNILQGISGYTQLLLRRGTNNHSEKYLEEIDLGTQRAAELVQQLLMFGRKMDIKIRPIDLKAEVIRVAQMLERTIPKMIEIQLDLPGDLWTVAADAGQLERVVMNLGINAAEAMVSQGRITFAASNMIVTNQDSSRKSETKPGKYVRFNVIDTGPGIDERTMSHIFEPFFTTKGVGQGTGLGLSTVYGIVKGHGGHISCWSKVGQGTTFDVLLPALPEQLPTGTTIQVSAEHSSGGETILLVDDEPAVVEILEEVLRDQGYNLLIAESGEAALDLYRETWNSRIAGQAIDLVVLDLGMPGMGGLDCLKELLKINPRQKVIISSGYSADSMVKRALEAGAQDFVSKPYRLGDMVGKLRQVLDM